MTTEQTSSINIETVDPEIVGREIERIEQQSALPTDSAVVLRDSFAPHFEQVVVLRAQASTISNPSDAIQQKLARTVRLGLKRVRCEVEAQRKLMKDESLRRGRAIDGYANVLKFMCEPVEEQLLAIEQHAERQEAARIAALAEERAAALVAEGADVSSYNLGLMDDATYQMILSGAKAHRADREEAERKWQAEQVAKANADRIAREKAEADAAEARAEAEKERKAREAAEIKARKEREAIEAKARKDREAAEAQLRAEREAREKAEREAAAARRNEQARIDADKARAAEESRAKREAEERAARAPDKQKLFAYAAAIRSLHAEAMTTEAGKVLARRTMNELCLVAGKLEQQAEAM